ncbi:MAG TPA: ABC transporter permease [Candidatus Krumholzibacteria bacterium]|nr:ABC transporter permease [Candidatus Krumholzibacteria bacterium]
MAALVLRRVLNAIVLVAITITLTFVVLHIIPGDPLAHYVEPGTSPADIARMRTSLGLDRPLPVQYLDWVRRSLTGDFGVSILHQRPVLDLIRETLPRTLLLTTLALCVQIGLGVAMGAFAARRRFRRGDGVASTAAVLLYSIPPFYLAYLLITWFAVDHTWLPTAGMHSPAGASAMDTARHLVLPVFVLGVAGAAGFARFVRGSLIDALAEDYARTARAKGLDEAAVLWRHAFRNALPVLITVAGLSAPFLLGGAVVVEAVFAWPGMGSLMVESVGARDDPTVLAITLLGAVLVIAGNLAADLAMLRADPRAVDADGGGA